MLFSSSPQRPLATIAKITGDSHQPGIVANTQLQGLPQFGTPGITYQPAEGEHVLLLTADGTQVVAGVLQPTTTTTPGELVLSSRGGATIQLRQDGSISLNGIVITKEGEILPRP